MPSLRGISLVLLLASVLGCGGGPDMGSVAVEPPPLDAKVTLEEIASSGSLQGKEDELRQELEGLRESHPAEAEQLLADYEQLVSQSSPASIKSKAQEMADKL